MPKDERERQILDKLTAIQDKLLLLKRDRTQYIRSQDVMVLHDQLVEQVRQLNEIRKGEHKGENRLDKVLESCLQLISLFFMTIGRTSEVPAAYALTSTIKRLLDHLTEARLFSAKDLTSISNTLDRLEGILANDEPHHSPYLAELLAHRCARCKSTLAKLREQLDQLDEPVQVVWERLISILRSMSLANTKSKFSTTEVLKLKAKLREIEESMVDGKFLGEDGQELRGSEAVAELLRRCLAWSDIVLERKGVIPDAFKDKYNILINIRNDLEKLSITQAWSLRETDLYDFQRQLDKIDEARVDGNWLDQDGNPAELYVQRTLLYLIRRSYGYIYHLMNSSEPVSEALLPIYNQLQTLKRCLIEVKNSGGVSSVRELYPYSMKLNSIDNMRVDGKFMVGDDIPEGQGSVSELLAECFELNYELRVAAEEAAERREDEESQSSAPQTTAS
ncbi:hypothetical protein MYCTH_2058974 [Thermothelomyces thermophilus ATCC 42464]|uniref:Uncharacterized protein n=1 Tax=Thermothelomyces thermophilus (strain ATCC 42464 / BCRC 31852 / DSM 1799) TaxID=573729 RepID=G2Q8N1_THET4|nr:uncharacterized protein MYCTH_2058974 [Thermothelomyces thermophilus ATCC 42464]AEO57080.1 hypothetical protein MYCTH_2058974 [Thermothelomyces thermophilus ATCC 42464]